MNDEISIRLYSIADEEWISLQPNADFRSTDVYICPICGTESNLWTMNGNKPRIYCQLDLYIEHDKLETAQKNYLALIMRLKNFLGRKEEKDLIITEKGLLAEKIDLLHKMLEGRDDLIIVNSKAKINENYPFSRYNMSKNIWKC